VAERASPAGRAGVAPGVLFAVPSYPPPLVGGLERQAHELARTLVRRGVAVEVISGRHAPGQSGRDTVDGVTVRRLPAWPRPFRSLGQALGIAWWMVRLHRRYGVVHLHNISWFGAVTLSVAWVLRRPVLTKLPGLGPIGGLPLQLARRGGWLWLLAFRRSGAVVAMSHESVREARSVGIPVERIFRTTNGVDTTVFRPAADGGSRRGVPTAVYVGRLSHEKGVMDLVEAWRIVVERVRGARLLLYGSGPEEPALRRRVRDLGLEGSVDFRGATGDVPSALRGADVFVLPSHTEGNSNALLEAMATGLAPVATAVGGSPMLLGPEGSECLVPLGDPAALPERIARLLQDPEQRGAVGRAMLERARSHFDLEIVAEAYCRAYQCLARGEPDRICGLAARVFEAEAAAP
jgi:glycosyltransferase involved in cell wall biosynthesis